MKTEQVHVTEKILNLTLEIIYLLTGKIMNKSGDHITITVPSTHLLISERNNEKILEVTQKIIELLTAEVPIRCQDVTVYFSMEEWDYLEGHKDLYKDVMMENQPPLTPPDILYKESNILSFPSQNHLTEGSGIKVSCSTEKALPLEQTKSHTVEKTEPPASCQDEAYLPCSDDSTHHTGFTVTQIKEESLSAEDDFTATGKSVTQFIYNDSDHEMVSDTFHSFEQQYEFFQYSNLEDHFTVQKQFSHSAYGNPPVGVPQNSHGRRTYTCLHCGKCFRSNSDLVVHRRMHTAERAHACPQCGKTFNRKSNLAIHVRTHTGEKPFSCAICGKRFKSNSDCIVHQRIHTGEKPYPCYECGRSFVSSSHRISHLRSHTGERPHSCSLCGKGFRNRSDLSIHERAHTGEKPFPCDKCGKGFACKSSLVRHQNRKLHQVKFPDMDGT